MWQDVFTQAMADAFIKHHLLNPAEFLDAGAAAFHRRQRSALSECRGQQLEWPTAGSDLPAGYSRARKTMGTMPEGGTARPESCSGLHPQRLQVRPTARRANRPAVRTEGMMAMGPMILGRARIHFPAACIHLDVEHGRVWWSGLDGKDFHLHTAVGRPQLDPDVYRRRSPCAAQ